MDTPLVPTRLEGGVSAAAVNEDFASSLTLLWCSVCACMFADEGRRVYIYRLDMPVHGGKIHSG